METRLDDRQEAAAKLLGKGMTSQEVADEIGVGIATVNRWRLLPGFGDIMAASSKEFYDLKVRNVEDRMAALENKALEVLDELLEKNKNDSVRLKAAVAVLSHQNARKKDDGEGQVLVNFNLPEPGMPKAEAIEEGDTSDRE